jgi:hypothetical protein
MYFVSSITTWVWNHISILALSPRAIVFVMILLEYMHGIREGGVLLLLLDDAHSDCCEAGLGSCSFPSVDFIALLPWTDSMTFLCHNISQSVRS